MNYYLLDTCINGVAADGSGVFLPLEDNGTPEWDAYKTWLSEGNTPLPALEAAGLTVAELKELFGLA